MDWYECHDLNKPEGEQLEYHRLKTPESFIKKTFCGKVFWGTDKSKPVDSPSGSLCEACREAEK